MKIDIHPEIAKELAYIIELHQRHGASNTMDNTEELVAYVLASIAEGSRRPGSWERQLLSSIGLVADCQAHEIYRDTYGKPGAL